MNDIKELMSQVYNARQQMLAERQKVRAPADCLPILDKYATRKQEEFIVVYLNGAHEIIGHKSVTKGLLNRTVVHPREVFREAIKRNCAAVILAHNHPSGSIEPSGEDKGVTEKLVKAGELLGIPVLDHIIVAKHGYYSMLEHDMLK